MTTQVLRGAPATIRFQPLDQHGQPRSTTFTGVVVTRADGTAVTSGAVVLDGSEATFELSAAHTAILDRLRAVWTETGGASFETFVDIVGGYYFTLDEARGAGPGLTNTGTYPDALVIAARRIVEEECERITGRAFVPRYHRMILSGNDRSTLHLPHPDIRNLRSLAISTTPGVWFAADNVDDYTFDGSGRLVSPYGLFMYGSNNVRLEYEYGLDAPPQRIKSAALLRFRDVIDYTKANAPERNTYQVIEGRVFGVSQPGLRGSKTGIPDVDAAYDEWAFRRPSAASIPLR